MTFAEFERREAPASRGEASPSQSSHFFRFLQKLLLWRFSEQIDSNQRGVCLPLLSPSPRLSIPPQFPSFYLILPPLLPSPSLYISSDPPLLPILPHHFPPSPPQKSLTPSPPLRAPPPYPLFGSGSPSLFPPLSPFPSPSPHYPLAPHSSSSPLLPLPLLASPFLFPLSSPTLLSIPPSSLFPPIPSHFPIPISHTTSPTKFPPITHLSKKQDLFSLSREGQNEIDKGAGRRGDDAGNSYLPPDAAKRHHQGRRAAFAVRHHGDQRDHAEGRRPDDDRRAEQEGRPARQEAGSGGRRPGLQLAAVRRKGRASCWPKDKVVGRVRLLDLGVPQVGAAGVRGAQRPAVLSGAVRRRGELAQRVLHRRGAEPAGDPGRRLPDEDRGRREALGAGRHRLCLSAHHQQDPRGLPEAQGRRKPKTS